MAKVLLLIILSSLLRFEYTDLLKKEIQCVRDLFLNTKIVKYINSLPDKYCEDNDIDIYNFKLEEQNDNNNNKEKEADNNTNDNKKNNKKVEGDSSGDNNIFNNKDKVYKIEKISLSDNNNRLLSDDPSESNYSLNELFHTSSLNYNLLPICYKKALLFCNPSMEKSKKLCENANKIECEIINFHSYPKCPDGSTRIGSICKLNCNSGNSSGLLCKKNKSFEQHVISKKSNEKIDEKEYNTWGAYYKKKCPNNSIHLGLNYCLEQCQPEDTDIGLYCLRDIITNKYKTLSFKFND